MHADIGCGSIPPISGKIFAACANFVAQEDLVRNVAIRMRRPDVALQRAINAAIDPLWAGGTIALSYSRYGVTLPPPK